MVIIEGRKGRWGLLGLVEALDLKPFMCSNRLQITSYHLTFIVTCMFVVASILRATTQHKTLVES